MPESVLPVPPASSASELDYAFTFNPNPFQIQITRVADGHVLLDTGAQLIFEEQYLELSTRFAPTSTLIGLGERVRQMPLDGSSGEVGLAGFGSIERGGLALGQRRGNTHLVTVFRDWG